MTHIKYCNWRTTIESLRGKKKKKKRHQSREARTKIHKEWMEKNYLEIDIYKILSLNSHKASTIVSNNRSANPSTNVKALKKYVRDY